MRVRGGEVYPKRERDESNQYEQKKKTEEEQIIK